MAGAGGQHHPPGAAGGAAAVASTAATPAPAAAGPGEDSSDSEAEQEGPQKLIRKVSTSGQIRTKVRRGQAGSGEVGRGRRGARGATPGAWGSRAEQGAGPGRWGPVQRSGFPCGAGDCPARAAGELSPPRRSVGKRWGPSPVPTQGSGERNLAFKLTAVQGWVQDVCVGRPSGWKLEGRGPLGWWVGGEAETGPSCSTSCGGR